MFLFMYLVFVIVVDRNLVLKVIEVASMCVMLTLLDLVFRVLLTTCLNAL